MQAPNLQFEGSGTVGGRLDRVAATCSPIELLDQGKEGGSCRSLPGEMRLPPQDVWIETRTGE
jgi:hypothetical protein